MAQATAQFPWSALRMLQAVRPGHVPLVCDILVLIRLECVALPTQQQSDVEGDPHRQVAREVELSDASTPPSSVSGTSPPSSTSLWWSRNYRAVFAGGQSPNVPTRVPLPSMTASWPPPAPAPHLHLCLRTCLRLRLHMLRFDVHLLRLLLVDRPRRHRILIVPSSSSSATRSGCNNSIPSTCRGSAASFQTSCNESSNSINDLRTPKRSSPNPHAQRTCRWRTLTAKCRKMRRLVTPKCGRSAAPGPTQTASPWSRARAGHQRSFEVVQVAACHRKLVADLVVPPGGVLIQAQLSPRTGLHSSYGTP